jgi:hypothetical protein
MSTPPKTLIITSGDVVGLLAVAATEQKLGLSQIAVGDVAVLFPGLWPEDQGERRLAAVREQAACYGLSIAERSLAPTGSHGFNAGELETLLLVDALAYARRAGFDELVWAVHAGAGGKDGGPDVDRSSLSITRTILAERLLALDAGTTPVKLRSPYADLTDRQLADLVVDMDLAVWTCWWWASSNDHPSAYRELTYWTGLLRDAGWIGRATQPEPTAR